MQYPWPVQAGSSSDETCNTDSETGSTKPQLVAEILADCNRVKNRDRCVSRSVVLCTPSLVFSEDMQRYIDLQTKVAKKQWVYDILSGTREASGRLLQTKDFVLLPDTEAPNNDSVINWLAIFTDTSLTSIRSLRGEHIPLLKACRDQCMEYITRTTHFDSFQIMAYFHYLPSVFQLHVHFCAPYGQYTTLDICKIHTLDNVISNLEIDPEYYQKACITTVIIGKGELSNIYRGPGTKE